MPASAITSAASAPALQLLVAGIVALVLLAAGAVPLARKAGGSALVYGAAAAICVLVLGTALSSLGGAPASLILPPGLPELGGRLRLDALAAVGLDGDGLGGAAASPFALGFPPGCAPGGAGGGASPPGAMPATSRRRNGCCPSIPPSWPA